MAKHTTFCSATGQIQDFLFPFVSKYTQLLSCIAASSTVLIYPPRNYNQFVIITHTYKNNINICLPKLPFLNRWHLHFSNMITNQKNDANPNSGYSTWIILLCTIIRDAVKTK